MCALIYSYTENFASFLPFSYCFVQSMYYTFLMIAISKCLYVIYEIQSHNKHTNKIKISRINIY